MDEKIIYELVFWAPVHAKPFNKSHLVSNTGEVKNIKRNRILKQSLSDGYYRISLSFENSAKTFRVHRLVAEIFCEKRTDIKTANIVNHIDGNKVNNDSKNLEWVTVQENNIHARKLGLITTYRRPVLQFDMNEKFLNRYISLTEALQKTGVNHTNILNVCKGKKYCLSAGGYKWRYESKISDEVPDISNWKTINNYPNYLVSFHGKIYSKYSKRLIKNIPSNGYYSVDIRSNGKRKRFKVHQLVAQSYIPNPENKKYVNHLDYNRSNNKVENLEWVTHSENMFHASKKRYKKVVQYSKNGTKIRIFDSITGAHNETGAGKSHIVQVCKGKRPTAGGYIWKYFEN